MTGRARVRLPRRWIARAVLAVLLGTLGCPGVSERPRRFVLITVDTLRRDALLPRVGAHPMRRLRDRAKRGALFTRAYAATASTQPTHASLLTGRHPWQHGVTRNGLVLPERETTLAERFHAAGYATHAVVASVPLDPRFGFGQGFDGYEATFSRRVDVTSWGGRVLDEGRFYSLGDAITRRARRWLAAVGERDSFLWVHYFDPHAPYGDTVGRSLDLPEILSLAEEGDPRLPEVVVRARALYRRDLASLDRALARLLRQLEGDASRFETHVVLAADHGESFGEGGSLGHGQRLTPAEIAVPLIVWSPEVAAGERDDVTGSVDVAATLLGLAGLPAADVEGRDLAAGAAHGAAFGMRRTYAQPFEDARIDGSVVLEGDRFYAVRSDALLVGDRRRVVRDDDPTRPVEGVVADSHRDLFGTFEDALAATSAAERLDPATQKALRALGYVR